MWSWNLDSSNWNILVLGTCFVILIMHYIYFKDIVAYIYLFSEHFSLYIKYSYLLLPVITILYINPLLGILGRTTIHFFLYHTERRQVWGRISILSLTNIFIYTCTLIDSLPAEDTGPRGLQLPPPSPS